MSTEDSSTQKDPKAPYILPSTGKLFFEQQNQLVLCKPHLMPLKSITLEKLEKMQLEARTRLQETRAKASEESF